MKRKISLLDSMKKQRRPYEKMQHNMKTPNK